MTHVLPITITDHSGTVTFAGIQVGHWDILVQLFDEGGVEIYTGTGEAIVTKDATTTVTIRVEHNTGTLIINVEVPGLVLWSKLGSVTEVQNSEIGPDLAVQGGPSFDPCKFDNGVHSPNNETDYVYGDSSLVLVEKGCVEFYWKPPYGSDITGLENVSTFFHISPNEPMPGSAPNDSNQLLFMFIPVHSPDHFNFRWSYVTKVDNTQYTVHHLGLDPNAFATDEVIHLAVVWDKNKSIEGQYSLAVYQNGVLLGGTDEDIDVRSSWGFPYLGIAGKGKSDLASAWDGCKGPVDNIKIWNYPKTNFSDRFME